MAWNSSTSWVSGDTPTLATVLNNIGLDIRTWGGNVDGGGYNLTNLAQIHGASNVLKLYTNSTERVRVTDIGVGIGTAGAPDTVLHVKGSAATIKLSDNGGGYCAMVFDTAARDLEWINEGAGGFNLYDLTAAAYRLKIGSTGVLSIVTTPTYADNTAALAGGLIAGMVYRTSTGTLMVVY